MESVRLETGVEVENLFGAALTHTQQTRSTNGTRFWKKRWTAYQEFGDFPCSFHDWQYS